MDSVDAVIAALSNGPSIVLPLVREVPGAILKRRPKPGKWSAHEHACHLAAIHPMIFGRLDLMLTDPSPRITPYLPTSDEEEGGFLKQDLSEALERYSSDRRRLVERVKALSGMDWRKSAEHGEYSHYSVFIMLRHLAMHDLFHAYRIEELLLKKDWD